MHYETFNVFHLLPGQGQQVQSKPVFLMCTTFLSAGKVPLKSLNLLWLKIICWAARDFQAFQGNNNSFEISSCGSSVCWSLLTFAVSIWGLKWELCSLAITRDTLAREILLSNFYITINTCSKSSSRLFPMNLSTRGFVKCSCDGQKKHEGQILATHLSRLFPTRPVSPRLPSSLLHTINSSFFCTTGICLEELRRFPPCSLFSLGEDVLSLAKPWLGPTCTWA